MDTLIFLHVPKAAGNTFLEFLLPNFSEATRFDVNAGLKYVERLKELKAFPDERKRELKLIYGHLPYGVHKWLPQPARYITFLRDPVDRIISHYYFVREQPRHPLHAAVMGKSLSLASYVQSNLSGELNNGMTRLLSGRSEQDSLHGHEPCTEADFLAAIQHVHQRFASIGLVDQFDRSLRLFVKLFGWSGCTPQPKNVTKRRQPVSQLEHSTLRAIERANEYDMELYALVRQRFEQQCNVEGILPEEHTRIHGTSIVTKFLPQIFKW